MQVSRLLARAIATLQSIHRDYVGGAGSVCRGVPTIDIPGGLELLLTVILERVSSPRAVFGCRARPQGWHSRGSR